MSRGHALVKLAYRGTPSRAEFPLTEEFASHSNNSRVGLSGHARIIQDVAAYVALGGEYYTCDPTVQAEACVPVLDCYNVVGIIDLETQTKQHFSPHIMCVVVAAALVAAQIIAAQGIRS